MKNQSKSYLIMFIIFSSRNVISKNKDLAISAFYISLEKEAEKKVLNFLELVRLTTRIYKIGTQEFFQKSSI